MTNKKKAITTALAALILAFSSVSMSVNSKSHESQNMAQRWQGGELRYAQISVFYPQGKNAFGVSETEIMREKIESGIKSGSFKADNNDERVWEDAWSSAASSANVSVYDTDTARTDSIASGFSVIGVGGDFFDFHPMRLLTGSYIYDDELRNDRIVLDEQSAWNIFSSSDVVGMKVLIGGKEFEVAGVVKPEDNKDTEKAYPEKPVIYVHYAALEEAGLDTSLLCYESVIPNPVTNFAKNIILEKFGVNTIEETKDGKDPERELDVVITENSSRYSVSKLWNGLKNFNQLAVSDRSIAYPYWENAAKITGVRMEILFFISILAVAYIIIMIILTAAKLYLNRTWHLKDYLEDLMYRYTYKKRTSDYISLDINDTDERKEKKYEQ